jgi:hypothetical protein
MDEMKFSADTEEIREEFEHDFVSEYENSVSYNNCCNLTLVSAFFLGLSLLRAGSKLMRNCSTSSFFSENISRIFCSVESNEEGLESFNVALHCSSLVAGFFLQSLVAAGIYGSLIVLVAPMKYLSLLALAAPLGLQFVILPGTLLGFHMHNFPPFL